MTFLYSADDAVYNEDSIYNSFIYIVNKDKHFVVKFMYIAILIIVNILISLMMMKGIALLLLVFSMSDIQHGLVINTINIVCKKGLKYLNFPLFRSFSSHRDFTNSN